MRILAVALLLMLTVAACGDGEPTPPLPANLCQAIGPALLAQLAPGTVPTAAAQNHGRFELTATCEAHTDFDHNDLRVYVIRYGHCHDVDDGATFCHSDAAKDNRTNFDQQCTGKKRNAATLGTYSEPAGLGDAACQSLRGPHKVGNTRLTSGELSAELLVRAGPDQISVVYTGFDGHLTDTEATAGARKAALALLNALKTP